MTVRMDLNADVGESFGTWVLGDDEAMLEVVTSANVACGFHAGDPTAIRRTVARAAERGVVVGAQVGYRDLAGFGRRRIDMEVTRPRDGHRAQDQPGTLGDRPGSPLRPPRRSPRLLQAADLSGELGAEGLGLPLQLAPPDLAAFLQDRRQPP